MLEIETNIPISYKDIERPPANVDPKHQRGNASFNHIEFKLWKAYTKQGHNTLHSLQKDNAFLLDEVVFVAVIWCDGGFYCKIS